MPNVLVVEDERKLLESLRLGLSDEGFNVLTAVTGDDGYQSAMNDNVDVVVLDVMFPGRDGFQILNDLRKNGFKKPILMLTARDTVEDRVRGLDNGADDYLVKPFAFAELVARLRVLMRRETITGQFSFKVAKLEVDLMSRQVNRDGKEIELSQREFQLLEYLLRHKDNVVSREMLAHEVWHEPDVLTNIIDVYVNLLRKKIEKPDLPQLIHTMRGVGYVLRTGE